MRSHFCFWRQGVLGMELRRFGYAAMTFCVGQKCFFDTENKYAPTADSSNIILNPAAAEEGAVLTTQENKSLKYNILDTLHTISF